MRIPLFAAALIVSLVPLGAPSAALAHGGGSVMPAEVPKAPPGEGATAQEILRELEAKAAKEPETTKVIAEPVKSARRALERAHGARMAGDDLHARMLDGLALEWAEAARELDRAAAAERVAMMTSQRAHDVQTKAERARALLEETQARRERAAAELTKAEADAKAAASGAADAEGRRIEAAKKRGHKGGGAKPKAAGRKGRK